MKKDAAHPTPNITRVQTTSSLSVGSIAIEFLDTTWRVAAPVLLFVGIGIFADLRLGTKPWLTLLGTAIGFVGAALLIKKQLAAVNRAEDKK